jgi:uncharacterized membrane protein YfcA
MTGFGGGLLLPPILAPILGVQHVVPVLSFAMLITNVHRFLLYRKQASPKLIGMVLITMMPAVVLGAGLIGEAFLATDASISVAVNLTKAVIFNQLGGLPLHLLGMGVVIGACTVPGNYAARWILRRTSVRLHTRLLEAIVLIGGLSLLARPLWQPAS